MKKILIPEPSEDCIDLSEITSAFNGLILVSKDENIIGTILYDDNTDEWIYINSIDINNPIFSSEILLSLIKSIAHCNPNVQFYTTK